jgi:hypothetical protein
VRTGTKVLLGVFIACGVVLLVRHARTEMQVAVPRDMPQNAKFLQSGFDVNTNEPLGNWVACTLHDADGSDWCRVTDQKGIVLYQGDFLPTATTSPVGNDQLKVSTIDPKKMWVHGPVEGGPVPAIPLTNGAVLVPASDRYALLQRWASDSAEFDIIREGSSE